MPSEFIDRAKLEAEAAAYGELMHDRAERRAYYAFMAGAAAYAALLDAETTEEWGVQDDRKIPVRVRSLGRAQAIRHGDEEIVSRRVLYGPWLPSEGGES